MLVLAQKAIMLASFVLPLPASPARGAEYAVGAGVVGTGYGGQFQFLASNGHWCFGWDWGVAPASTFHDPYTGRPLTRTTESTTGPFAHYRFRSDARHSWYAGALLLRWSRTEKSLVFGDSRTASTTDPYIGGGFMSRLAKHLLFNGGFFIGPTARLTTLTSTSSTESSGNFVLQIVLALVS